jgi:hypothetical protein
MKKYYSILGYLILACTLVIPGIHKVLGEFPPQWFVSKFQSSLIGAVGAGIFVSYLLITLIELIGGVLLLIGAMGVIMEKPWSGSTYGVMAAHLLFLMLTFGNFLVQDYDGAFQDFCYFVGVVIITQLLIQNDQKN